MVKQTHAAVSLPLCLLVIVKSYYIFGDMLPMAQMDAGNQQASIFCVCSSSVHVFVLLRRVTALMVCKGQTRGTSIAHCRVLQSLSQDG